MATMQRLNNGHLVTANDWNAHVDQINSNTAVVETVGTGVFTETDTVSSWATQVQAALNRPGIVLRKNSNQVIVKSPDLTDQVVTWQVVQGGDASMKSGDTVVIPSAGRYLVTANVNLRPIKESGGSVPGEAVLYITKNGTAPFSSAIASFGQPGAVEGGLGNGLSTSTVNQFAQGDVLRVMVFQSSNVNRDARMTDFGGCTFSVSKL